MNDYSKLTYTTWESKFHLVWIPKPGESISKDNWSATVKDMDGNRIKNNGILIPLVLISPI